MPHPISTLPVILSVPHGGLEVPPESEPLLAIGAGDIYNECDLWADQLVDFESLGSSLGPDAQPGVTPARPLARVTTSISRAIVDMNRDPTVLDDPDGAVKTLTSYGRMVYTGGGLEGEAPWSPLDAGSALAGTPRVPPVPEGSRAFKRKLIQRYWLPFHTELRTALALHANEAKLYLDCHNMAQTGPTAYGDPGAQRPLICLANLGNARGDSRHAEEPTSCDGGFIRHAADIAEEVFKDMDLLSPGLKRPPIVAINRPYAGGYILRWFTENVHIVNGMPGMMIEVNRGLFVGDQTSDTPIAPPNLERIAEVRIRLKRWLDRLLGSIHISVD